MGITERKVREREEMRELILVAAQKVFLENGYEKTSIRGIADVIEYSPATIYLYYKDKNELFLALHIKSFQKLMVEFAEVDVVEDPFERLVELGRRYIKFAMENPELYDLMFVIQAPMEALACKEEVWEDGMRSFDLLKLIVEQCIKAGYFKGDEDIDITCTTIWSFMHGLMTLYLKDRMKMFGDEHVMDRIEKSFRQFVVIMKTSL